MTADEKRVRRSARELLDEAGAAAVPVDLDAVAAHLGAIIRYAPFSDDLSGMAQIVQGVPLIGINSTHARTRQRFTIAHEIAHLRLHRAMLDGRPHIDHGVLRRDMASSTGQRKPEVQANQFASELLMPEPLFDAALGGRLMDVEDEAGVALLAKRFRVSTAAVKFRLLAY